MGIVYTSGDFFNERRDEIINMLRNEEKKEVFHNPLDRIMTIHDNKDGVMVETTSENLSRTPGSNALSLLWW